ncbi:MAG TPA: response regulator transcription factor [Gammaproteobacteria bacterium]|nr:response regulator transcription factor [Gammaproteobacteria bacterium]
MKLLLIEDDEKISAFIIKGMRAAGFLVEHVSNGDQGLSMALTAKYDAAIIDIMLPGHSGLWVIDELRRKNITLPVIILSAKRTVDDRVIGFQLGGDDYLTKPFAFSELLARVQALIRRANNVTEVSHITVHDLSIDLVSRKVTRGKIRIDLQPREFRLLEYLMRHAGHVVSKTMLMENVWDYNFDPYTNVVEARICRLREKIDKGFDIALIHTVRGAGYVLKAGD